jgi:predicted NBD/HSP70 family sugar kinase
VIVSDLLEEGLVQEGDARAPSSAPTATGRPRIPLSIRPEGGYFAGLDIGNDTLTVLVVDLRGDEVSRVVEVAEPAAGPAKNEERLALLLESVLKSRPDISLRGIGMTVPGLIARNGELLWAPKLSWRNTRLGSHLISVFGVPVFVENDANAAAIGEAVFGSWVGNQGDVLYMLLDSGVGSGLLLGGRPYRGTSGYVGEVGHIQVPTADGGQRNIEDILGREAVLSEFVSRGGAFSLIAFQQAITERNPEALRIRGAWQASLAWLVSALVWVLDPTDVVFGGPMATLLSDNTIFQSAIRRNGITRDISRFRVSELGASAVILGAAALPLYAFFAIPTIENQSDTGNAGLLSDSIQ